MNASHLLKACLLGSTLLLLPVAHAAVTPESRPAATSETTRPVNINTADAATLAGSLRGIGRSKAEAIVAYRSENGPFKSVDDLVNVKGIGPKTLEQLRPMIAL
jgi:competence ComEA-like helix-hairpin-helix protein